MGKAGAGTFRLRLAPSLSKPRAALAACTDIIRFSPCPCPPFGPRACCVQVLLAELLRAWGDAGFEAHVRKVQACYARKAAALVDACSRQLQGLAEWQAPAAGMFLWMRLLGVEVRSPPVCACCCCAPAFFVKSELVAPVVQNGSNGRMHGKEGAARPWLLRPPAVTPLNAHKT